MKSRLIGSLLLLAALPLCAQTYYNINPQNKTTPQTTTPPTETPISPTPITPTPTSPPSSLTQPPPIQHYPATVPAPAPIPATDDNAAQSEFTTALQQIKVALAEQRLVLSQLQQQQTQQPAGGNGTMILQHYNTITQQLSQIQSQIGVIQQTLMRMQQDLSGVRSSTEWYAQPRPPSHGSTPSVSPP